MHESRLVADLMAQAETFAPPSSIIRLRFTVGPLATVSASALAAGTARFAADRWGHIPEIEVAELSDPTDARAAAITLASLTVEDPPCV